MTPPRTSSTRTCQAQRAPSLRRSGGRSGLPADQSPGGRRWQRLQSQFQLLRSRHPHAVEPGAAARYRSRSALYAPQHRIQRAAVGIYPANRSRPAVAFDRRPEHLVRDVPLAAQFLSMICCSIVATSRSPRRETAGGSAFRAGSRAGRPELHNRVNDRTPDFPPSQAAKGLLSRYSWAFLQHSSRNRRAPSVFRRFSFAMRHGTFLDRRWADNRAWGLT